MNILITGSRAPVALELIRAFGRAGHTVYASDTRGWTVGNHSRYLAGHFVTPLPRHDPDRFAEYLHDIIRRCQIDWLIPTSEEVFYVARSYDLLAAATQVFCEPLPVLAELHHKGRFQQRCAALGIATPRTVLLATCDELRAHLPAFPRFLLKPAFSRFATRIATNCGPLAGKLPPSACKPSPTQPWLLQEFVDGTAVCTYSTLHAGQVTAHVAYLTPRTVGGGTGVQFRATDGAATLAIVERLGHALCYTGQLSLDLIQNSAGLHVLECNPRTTSGVHLLEQAALVAAITRSDAPFQVKLNRRTRQISLALLADGALRPGEWRALFRQAVLADDVVFQRDDPLPALLQVCAGFGFGMEAFRKRISFSAAMTEDIEWNGDE